MTSHRPFRRLVRFPLALLIAGLSVAVVGAAPKDQASKAAPTASGNPVGAIPGMPTWKPPQAYSVDMVMQAEGTTFTMKRFIDGDRIRSEIVTEGQDIVMIELGDEAGTSYTLMPKEKQAIKTSRKAMMGVVDEAAAEEPAPADPQKVEFLGEEKLDGTAAKKYWVGAQGASVLAWFDAASSAPLRMESSAEGKTHVVEWKNLEAGPQPAKLFDVPKGFEVMDMDEMMAKMKGMGMGKGGMGMAGGMAGAMAGGMAQQAGQSFGSSMGSGFGASLGAAFGGPLGAMAGQYIGGKVGGWLGGKAASAVTPGP